MKTQQRLETPQALQLLNLLLPKMCLLFCNFAWVSFVHVVSYGRFYDGVLCKDIVKKIMGRAVQANSALLTGKHNKI